jgi:hypothetical protein
LYQNRLFTDIPATKILLELTVATLLLGMAYYGILRCRHSTMAIDDKLHGYDALRAAIVAAWEAVDEGSLTELLDATEMSGSNT